MRDIRRMSAAVLITLLTGCAGLHVTPEKDDSQGIRYYQRAPFLLVYTDNAGGLVTKWCYLPDTRKIMSAYPYAILATNKTTLDFTEGVLTGGEIEADSTVIPKAVLAALEKVVTTSLALAKNEIDSEATIPAPTLYRVDFENGQVKLVGSENTFFIKFGPDVKKPEGTTDDDSKTTKSSGGAQ